MSLILCTYSFVILLRYFPDVEMSILPFYVFSRMHITFAKNIEILMSFYFLDILTIIKYFFIYYYVLCLKL